MATGPDIELNHLERSKRRNVAKFMKFTKYCTCGGRNYADVSGEKPVVRCTRCAKVEVYGD